MRSGRMAQRNKVDVEDLQLHGIQCIPLEEDT